MNSMASPASDDDNREVEDYIYGDLKAIAENAATDRVNTTVQLDEVRQRNKQLEAEVASLKAQGRVWAKQRSVLVHNLGTLLKTAEVEMSRKDNEIKRLREVIAAQERKKELSRSEATGSVYPYPSPSPYPYPYPYPNPRSRVEGAQRGPRGRVQPTPAYASASASSATDVPTYASGGAAPRCPRDDDVHDDQVLQGHD